MKQFDIAFIMIFLCCFALRISFRMKKSKVKIVGSSLWTTKFAYCVQFEVYCLITIFKFYVSFISETLLLCYNTRSQFSMRYLKKLCMLHIIFQNMQQWTKSINFYLIYKKILMLIYSIGERVAINPLTIHTNFLNELTIKKDLRFKSVN
jgi:hypothetical protein